MERDYFTKTHDLLAALYTARFFIEGMVYNENKDGEIISPYDFPDEKEFIALVLGDMRPGQSALLTVKRDSWNFNLFINFGPGNFIDDCTFKDGAGNTDACDDLYKILEKF